MMTEYPEYWEFLKKLKPEQEAEVKREMMSMAASMRTDFDDEEKNGEEVLLTGLQAAYFAGYLAGMTKDDLLKQARHLILELQKFLPTTGGASDGN